MKLPDFDQWEIVRLEWMDSATCEPGWGKLRRKDRNLTGCMTVGQVYEQTDEALTVVLSRDTTNKHVNCAITIPTVNITRFRRFGGGKSA